MEKVFRIFSSLKLAVLVIFGLALSLAIATVIESVKDTPTAQFWVYHSNGFQALLFLLGINILCVALSRYPWKKNHLPFLLAHLGILLLLIGSFITQKRGVDGTLRISEGETASTLDLDIAALVIKDDKSVFAMPILWQPPGVFFKPMDTQPSGSAYSLTVDSFISHADSEPIFIAAESNPHSIQQGALHLRLIGGPMGISQDLWLWEGTPLWSSFQMGPAHFSLLREGEKISKKKPSQPEIYFFHQADGGLNYIAIDSQGKKMNRKKIKKSAKGAILQTPWKGNLTLKIEDWIENATLFMKYRPSSIQYGPQAPTSAIHVKKNNTQDTGIWLGLGDRGFLEWGEKQIEIGYLSRKVVLPFSLHLNRFKIDYDQGSLSPAGYASEVEVMDGTQNSTIPPKPFTISMNEPLTMGGYTFYQSSYEDTSTEENSDLEERSRPVTSIFSVSRDPGRPWKYLGSGLIVFGSLWLFLKKYRFGHAK